MYNKGSLVVYKRDVCKVVDIRVIHDESYYVLNSTIDSSLKIDVPVNKEKKLLRPLITKKELDNLINEIKFLPVLDVEARMLEDEYKRLLKDGTMESLITIIKTAHLRNKIRKENKKKLADNDQYYFNLAERYLYNEISYVLNVNYDDAKNYIIEKLNK